ncbi:MAG: response regulator [Candidatus Rokubacteria bacterium]|nr:response regulator [Candidatus Rokubacteria bacterium]
MDERVPTLLCVDDDPPVLQVMREYFTLRGFGVVTARSGVEAFLHVVRWAPKAVILDVFMPRLGGLEALKRIKTLDPEIVVILISGFPNALEMVAEAGLTVAGAFTKPVNLDRISETLTRAGVTLPPGATAGTLPTPARRPGPIRALVVDDEPDVRAMLTDYLRENGFEAVGVWGGQEALRLIPEFRPHIILLDILMPGLSGVETLRRLKPVLHETCIIIITAHEDVETARRTLEMGAVDYVRKPVNLRHLDALLGIPPGKDQTGAK